MRKKKKFSLAIAILKNHLSAVNMMIRINRNLLKEYRKKTYDDLPVRARIKKESLDFARKRTELIATIKFLKLHS